jgi:hypothetical protein
LSALLLESQRQLIVNVKVARGHPTVPGPNLQTVLLTMEFDF